MSKVLMTTDKGQLTIDLFDDDAPNTVANFLRKNYFSYHINYLTMSYEYLQLIQEQNQLFLIFYIF